MSIDNIKYGNSKYENMKYGNSNMEKFNMTILN